MGYAKDLVAIDAQAGSGIADAFLITGRDARGLSGHAVDLMGGSAPRTVLLEGLWSGATTPVAAVGAGVTLPHLVTCGLAADGQPPRSGAGAVSLLTPSSAADHAGR